MELDIFTASLLEAKLQSSCSSGPPSVCPFTIDGFFTYYTMLLVALITLFIWKVMKKTKLVKPHEADLVREKPDIDAYEASFEEIPVSFWVKILQMFIIKRAKQSNSA